MRSVSAAYQIRGEDQFRIIAYLRAAESIDRSNIELKDIWEKGRLVDVPGIGASLASHLDELFNTGKVKHFAQVMKGLPEAMFELINIPGIGAKTAHKLTSSLKLSNPKTFLSDLEKAAQNGKIREIEGFGEESEKEILRGIKEFKNRTQRMLLPQATALAEDVLTWLKEEKSVIRAEPLGSLRRQVSTVGDIDISVASRDLAKVIKHFIAYPKKSRIIESGTTTASILLPTGAQVDLMVQPVDSYGALLQHFTGSKDHNIHLRELALKKGLSLSEYGIKMRVGSGLLAGKAGKWEVREYSTEEEFYKALGMDWIPPELRENTGEIEAALEHKLPKLVELKDLKGDLHVHSDFNIETSHDEGGDSIEKILDKGLELGYEYIGFTEHNPSSSTHSASQILEILKKKKDKFEVVNKNYPHEKFKKEGVKNVFIHALNGLEIDIKPDGSLAIPEKGLDLLDFAIVSIHSSFKIPEREMTKRILSALDHPQVRILGHPTGRKLIERPPIDADWEIVFDFCLKKNIWLEINAWPERLDLPDSLVKEAVKKGLKMVISTDAHAVTQMGLIRFGVFVARRGWAEKKDIVNTLGYNEFVKELER